MSAPRAPAFRGVWATILLAVGPDGAIRYDALEGQIAAYAAAGCDGIYTGGTAAEFHTLGEREFCAVSERAAAAVRAVGLPLQIGAAHPLAPGSLVRIAFAASLAPDAIQVTLPDWTPIDFPTARRFLLGAAEAADGVPLVLYNPPHAKTVLDPAALAALADELPTLVGLKCGGGDEAWYAAMAPVLAQFSVFIPGHHYASGIAAGAHGSYSNMACLSPVGAVRWAALATRDRVAAAEIEGRIAAFMDEAVAPLLRAGHPGFVIDKAMAAAGAWSPITPRLLWPYAGVENSAVARLADAARRHIPEFAPSV